MTKKYVAGEELSGKVTGIQPYGAFVALDDETQGLVHISEITYGFVKDIHEFLTVGQEVNVKVLEVDDRAGKISLSIRALMEEPPSNKKDERPRKSLQASVNERDAEGFNSLKDKLQDWIEKSGQ
ncbi:S1 domain-containing post-transcriptional regulator GSP13 [Filibacter tadaridae]|uniref:General stress protein 13 n=1 Tax=Filibacter tadaridae TaxID=2483811 RepID=A0A3P5XB42_9BACL|nr:S1 domain-containing post-transcriptional regulator GSP13 [Filibacter tadaridae]VDC31887.1 General stress protein 13 [Filibacter tadaridae]